MADGSGLCNFNSACLPNENGQDPSELCLNSDALKCELIKTQDELKSAWLIIELLVNDVNTLKACSGASVSDHKSEDTKPDDLHKWIPVKQAHSNSLKRNSMIQSKNRITLSNSFEVLGNLDDITPNDGFKIPTIVNGKIVKSEVSNCVMKEEKATKRQGIKLQKLNHKVLIIGDSHLKGSASNTNQIRSYQFYQTRCISK
jgi:hypothetical protein